MLALHAGTGWAIGRWWAVALPLIVIPLAVPAGSPSLGEDPVPIWLGLAFFTAPLGMAVIGIAVAVLRLAREPRRPRPGRH